MQKVRYRVIFKKLQAAQLKHQIEITCSKIPSYLEAATHYLPSHQIFIFQHTLTYPTCPPPYRFNTATRRWLVAYLFQMARIRAFQHAAARRRLGREYDPAHDALCGFNTQPPESGWLMPLGGFDTRAVSTHSHPKVAGPEKWDLIPIDVFQHTATRRRLQ